MNLEGKVALVTGGCRGIGRGIALALARAGADVAVADLPGQPELAATGAEIAALGRQALALEADVRRPADAQRMVAAVVSAWGRLDILVNNAGVGPAAPFLEVDEAAWDLTMDTNAKGMFFCAQAAARAMAPRRYGRIVNITSTASQVAIAGLSHYCISKAAAAMVTRALALELGPLGITVNAVGPSTVPTRLNEFYLSRPDAVAREAAAFPLGRLGTPEDIGACVVFLASDAASWVTGQNLIADGGLLTQSPQPKQ